MKPIAIVRPWNDRWQTWARAKKGSRWVLASNSDTASSRGAKGFVCAIPARLVVSVPFWVEAENDKVALEIARLELEMKGFSAGERIFDEVKLTLLRREGVRLLVMGEIFPVSWPEGLAELRGQAYHASPKLAVLGDDGVHLWTEQYDLVAAVVWQGQLVCWDTMPLVDAREQAECWLKSLTGQLREELGINGELSLHEWVPLFPAPLPGFSSGRRLTDKDREQGPVADSSGSDPWVPLPFREVLEAGRRRLRLARVSVFAAAFLALLGLLALVSVVGVNREIRNNELRFEALKREGAPLREAARQWSQLEIAVQPALPALDVLRLVVASLPPSGVRLTIFEMSEDKVLVEGEASDVGVATAFYDALRKGHASGLEWEMPSPLLQANNTARFLINGTRSEE